MTAGGAIKNPFFQVGVLVKDIEAARDDLSRSLGIVWSDVVDRELGEWRIRACFSKQGPPYLELIEGPSGSPWDSGGASRIDHVGLWTDDLDGDKQRLEAEGLVLEADGAPLGVGFTYHRGQGSGLRIELLASSGKAAFYERWGLDDAEA